MVGKVIAIVLALGVLPCLGQSNLLQITSPATGTIVNPGQVVTISVSADPSVSNVAIIADDPLGFSQTTNGQSLQFQLTIPSDTTIGAYDVSAMGTAPDGSAVDSPPISLQVDSPNTQFVISTVPSVLRFSAPGEAIPLHVIGTFPDGSQLDMTHSVQIEYSSANSQVATIDSQGIVTAVGPGSTYVGPCSNIMGQISCYNVNTTVGQLATMITPPNGSVLSSSAVNFQWNGITTATAYRLQVGSMQGGDDCYESGTLPPTTLSQTVPGALNCANYATLWTQINGQWANNQYSYYPAQLPDYTISAAPSSLTVAENKQGTSTINVTTIGEYGLCYQPSLPISLSASGLPSGTTASFNPSAIFAAPGPPSSTLTLSVGRSTPVGSYTVTVNGFGCTVQHTTNITLTVVRH